MAITNVTGGSTGLVTLVADTTQSFQFTNQQADYVEIVNSIADMVYLTMVYAETAVTPATDGTYAVGPSSTGRFRLRNTADTVINVESATGGDICIQLLRGEGVHS